MFTVVFYADGEIVAEESIYASTLDRAEDWAVGAMASFGADDYQIG